MTDSKSPAFSWVCPACGRRVPRKAADCRCGHHQEDSTGPASPSGGNPRGRSASTLAAGAIVLVAGSQGVSTELEVTALPESAADTTAEALAAALGGTHVVYLHPSGTQVR